MFFFMAHILNHVDTWSPKRPALAFDEESVFDTCDRVHVVCLLVVTHTFVRYDRCAAFVETSLAIRNFFQPLGVNILKF